MADPPLYKSDPRQRLCVLRALRGSYSSQGSRLHNDPALDPIIRRAAELVASLEDQRTQPAQGRVPQLDVTPLAEMAKQVSGLRLVLLGAFHAAKRDVIERLAASGAVSFEIATLEGAGGVSRLIDWVTVDRILFGSAAPFFYIESARLKLQESELAGRQLEQICSANAARLMSWEQ
jgi:hypothetical protein